MPQPPPKKKQRLTSSSRPKAAAAAPNRRRAPAAAAALPAPPPGEAGAGPAVVPKAGPAVAPKEQLVPKLDDLDASTVVPHINASYNADFEDMLVRLLQEFSVVRDDDPLGITSDGVGGGGVLPSFDVDKCNALLENKRSYGPVAINMFWMDLRHIPQRGVPINAKGIRDLQQHAFSEAPSAWPDHFQFRIAVRTGQDIMAELGRLIFVSPEEPLHAFLWGVHSALLRSCEERERNQWVTLMRTLPAVFEGITRSFDVFLRSRALREDAKAVLLSVERSPLACIMEVVQFKKTLLETTGNASNEHVCTEYKRHVKFAPGSEEVTMNMLMNVQSLWNTCLSDPFILNLATCLDGPSSGEPRDTLSIHNLHKPTHIHALCFTSVPHTEVQQTEELKGKRTPFDSILKMTMLAQKTSQSAPRHERIFDIRWVFASLADLAREHIQLNNTLTMADVGQKGKCITIQHILIFKKQIRDYVTHSWLDTMDLTMEVKAKLREILIDHASYRKNCGYRNNNLAQFTPPSGFLSWKSGWSQPVRMVLSLLEAVIFYQDHNGTLKSALHHGKTASEMLEYGGIGEELAVILDKLRVTESNTAPPAALETAAASTTASVTQTCGNLATVHVDLTCRPDQEDEFHARWKAFAQQQCREFVTFIAGGTSEETLVHALSQTNAFKLDSTKAVLCIYDKKTSGESKTHPKHRQPPFRQLHLQRTVGASLQARWRSPGQPLDINHNDVFCFFDGFTHSPRQQLQKVHVA